MCGVLGSLQNAGLNERLDRLGDFLHVVSQKGSDLFACQKRPRVSMEENEEIEFASAANHGSAGEKRLDLFNAETVHGARVTHYSIQLSDDMLTSLTSLRWSDESLVGDSGWLSATVRRLNFTSRGYPRAFFFPRHPLSLQLSTNGGICARSNWQVGNHPPFDPMPRIAWRDRDRDIVLLRITQNEALSIGPCIISAPAKWPPAPTDSPVAPGQVLVWAGTHPG